MSAPVDVWSSPTTVWAGGLRQLPQALGGRPMLLVADARLPAQMEAVLAYGTAAEVLTLDADGTAPAVVDAVRAHPGAVPVALGGGSVMDVVRLAALAAVDPAADGFAAPADGVTVLPSRATNPTICLPTTLGTASEVSPVAIRHSAAGSALLLSPALRSAAAVLDPRLTGTLSVEQQLAGLVEPWARACVPAVTGTPLPLQDELARGLGRVLLALGDEATTASADRTPDDPWRTAAAQASVQTHLGLLAVGRDPAGHLLWPLAVEAGRSAGVTKAAALGAIIPAWLACLADGSVGPVWGSAARVRAILGLDPADAVARMTSWLSGLGLPTRLPDLDVAASLRRVRDPWQASNLFLPGVAAAEIEAVLSRAAGPAR